MAFMEACFHDRIKSTKHICDLLSHNSDFYIGIESLHLVIQTSSEL